MTFPFPHVVAGGEVELTYTQGGTDSAPTTSTSFTSRSFGDEASDRYIVVAVAYLRGTTACTISSVTIGGVTATSLVEEGFDSNGKRVALFAAHVPTGTSGTVTVNTNIAASAMAIAVHRLVGVVGTTTDTTGQTSSLNADSRSLSAVTINNGGVALFASLAQNPSITCSWTNATELQVELYADVNCTLSTALVTDAGNPTVTASWTGGNTKLALVGASWS